MKILKSVLILLFLCIVYEIGAQPSSLYVPYPEYNLPDKMVQVRFIYICKEDPADPGNFTLNSNGGAGGPIANGEVFADTIINRANKQLTRNNALFPYLFEPPAVYKAGYKFQRISPSLYISNDLYYEIYLGCEEGYAFFNSILNDYNADTNHVIHVFSLKYGDGSSYGGCANGGTNGVRMSNAWFEYKRSPGNINVYKNFAMVMTHEIGHLFKLEHEYCASKGDTSKSNYCDDIPSAWEMDIPLDSICKWNSEYETNNLMGYGNHRKNFSITPCQLGQIHYDLCSNNHVKLWLLRNENIPPPLTVTSATNYLNKPYPIVGESIQTSGSIILQVEKPTVFLASNSISITTGFTVPRNSTFHASLVNIGSSSKSGEKSTNPDQNIRKPIEELFLVYPNPNKGTFTIQVSMPAQIDIYTSSGQRIHSFFQADEYSSIDLSGQSPGVYIIRFIGENKCVSERIIIA